jgi:hypothetical protein
LLSLDFSASLSLSLLSARSNLLASQSTEFGANLQPLHVFRFASIKTLSDFTILMKYALYLVLRGK